MPQYRYLAMSPHFWPVANATLWEGMADEHICIYGPKYCCIYSILAADFDQISTVTVNASFDNAF